MRQDGGHEVRFDSGMEGSAWTVRGATIAERLHEPYVATVDLVHEDVTADAGALLGRTVTVALRTAPDREERLVGIVSQVRESGAPTLRAEARVVIEPALAALRHRQDSRIFQGRTVPEILEEVLGAGLAPFGRAVTFDLDASYPPREYTVQYRESDLDFAHRLIEEEGLVYFFRHDGEVEELVLIDAARRHPPVEGDEDARVRFDPARPDQALGTHRTIGAQAIRRLDERACMGPTSATLRTFDWTHPAVRIEHAEQDADEIVPRETYEHEAPLTFSAYDGTYGAHDAPRKLALIRERQRRDTRTLEGDASALCLRAGRRFELYGHPHPGLDAAYTLVRSEHRWLAHAEGGAVHQVHFECVPAEVQWRPSRSRDRPRIGGVQTATVVGPSGQEIHADPHGRIRVQFHWDRVGGLDERSSCWIRVSQAMGGPGWGFSFVPRIGMEVVVAFVEGDPDRPLVVGAVYNAENPCPLDLPADKTRTTMRSQTSPGGGGSSELQLEDRAGAEYIYLHAQKDWNTLVLNDVGAHIRRDELQTVARDRSREVRRDETTEVGNDRTKKVDGNQREQVGENRIRLVGRNETVSIGQNQALSVGADQATDIGADSSTTVMLDQSTEVGGDQLRSFQKSASSTVGGDDALKVGGDKATSVVENAVTKTGGSELESVAGNASSKTSGASTETTKRSVIRRTDKGVSERIAGDRARDSGRFHGLYVMGTLRAVTVTLDQTLESKSFNATVGEHFVEVGGDLLQMVAGDMSRVAKTRVDLEGGDEGKSTFSLLASNGSIELTAKQQLTLESAGELRIKGKAGVTIKSAAGVVIDGATVTVK